MNDTTPLPPRTKVRKPRLWLRFLLMIFVVAVLGAGLLTFHQFKANILKQVTTQIRSQLPVVASGTAVMSDWQPRRGSGRSGHGRPGRPRFYRPPARPDDRPAPRRVGTLHRVPVPHGRTRGA